MRNRSIDRLLAIAHALEWLQQARPHYFERSIYFLAPLLIPVNGFPAGIPKKGLEWI